MKSETTYHEIRTAADADAIRERIEYVFDGWFADAPRIDWEDFIERLERGTDDDGAPFDFGATMDSPAIKRIRAIVRTLREQLR